MTASLLDAGCVVQHRLGGGYRADFQHGEIGQVVESIHRLDRQIAATRTASRLYIESAIRRQLSAQLVAAQEGELQRGGYAPDTGSGPVEYVDGRRAVQPYGVRDVSGQWAAGGHHVRGVQEGSQCPAEIPHLHLDLIQLVGRSRCIGGGCAVRQTGKGDVHIALEPVFGQRDTAARADRQRLRRRVSPF